MGNSHEINLHPLEEGGILRELFDNNRAPFGFYKGRSGEKRDVIFFVPPEGTKPVDKLTGSVITGYDVVSPEGEQRGMCATVVVTPDQSRRIKKRLDLYRRSAPKQ